MFSYKVMDESVLDGRIRAGDVVVIKKTNEVAPHEIAAIACDDDVSKLTFRRVVLTEMKRNVIIVGKVVRLEISA